MIGIDITRGILTLRLHLQGEYLWAVQNNTTYFSIDEYLAREEQAFTKSEYIDGWIRAMCGASLRHNMVSGNCFVTLSVLLKGKPCRHSTRTPRFALIGLI